LGDEPEFKVNLRYIRRSCWSKAASAKSETLTRAKRAGGMAQAVEFLPNEYEALCSNPVPPKRKEKRERERERERRFT
jgi:hypothetical protein